MAAGVGHFEAEVLEHFLARLHFVGQVLALAHVAAAAFVDREFGVDQVLVVLHEPVDAVEIAAFFVGREREDQIAVGDEAFLLQPNHVGDELRRHRLVVARAAAIEPAVLLEKGERIERPVLALRLDDVEVREEQQRPPRAGAVIADDEVVLARIGAEEVDVGVRKSRRPQPRGHRLGRFRHVSCGRVGRVDLDELFVDLTRARVVRSGLRGERGRHENSGKNGSHGQDYRSTCRGGVADRNQFLYK